ncbi:MAG TPA: hypothetical protein VK188_13165 [Holophaga sp.]|nr:hypothetical protein [Holophaga sp.]
MAASLLSLIAQQPSGRLRPSGPGIMKLDADAVNRFFWAFWATLLFLVVPFTR